MLPLAFLQRRRILVALPRIAIALVVIYLLTRLVAFANLLGVFRDHTGLTITQEAVLAANQSNYEQHKPAIPKILHQIFHNWHDPGNNTIPTVWNETRIPCMQMNPGWEFKLWYEKESREFIEKEYPWFLSTYDGYKFPVQRIDTLRYFLLRHYGGIYIDMDNPCTENMDPLIYYPAWTTEPGRGALSNNVLGALPGHPFWLMMTDNLIPWNWNWFLPYVVVQFQSGQWYLTAMWDRYHSRLRPDGTVRGYEQTGNKWAPLYRIMMDDRPGSDRWIFFTQTVGGTWLSWDFPLIIKAFNYWKFMVLGVVVILGGTYLLRRRRRRAAKAAARDGDEEENKELL
ncbi:putative mannosyl phosphorylinositol ceramide synthase CSH1 [Xylariales sp. PMI_506]|nr:putative mannosyl phosphorylinositol ceramide synthase CSH1 [Xylariales sp. PMI_506]